VTIICRLLRGTGSPYTKRILPEYLIPRSPFFSEALVKLLEDERHREPGFIDAACAALGCVDARTARKHLGFVRAAVQAKLPVLAELVVATPGPSEESAFPPGTKPVTILRFLWTRFLTAVQERSGSFVALSLRPLLWVGPGFESWRIFHRSCIPLAREP
jgi:hypothetical protein